MNIFVCVKQVPDTETKVLPNGDKTFINLDSIKWIMNPYDEFAVEQALLIKATNASANITIVRVGSVRDSEAVRTAMAMGADDGILVEANDNLDSFMIAKALKGAIDKSGKKPDLVLCGKQAIDDDCMQVPQILGAMLDVPHVAVVVKFEMNGTTIKVNREIEGGAQEVFEVSTPCLIATNKGINTPRYASLPGIMKAKKKPMAQYTLADVGVSDADRKVKYSNFRLPPEKPAGKKLDAMDDAKTSGVVTEVVNLLRSEAKVI